MVQKVRNWHARHHSQHRISITTFRQTISGYLLRNLTSGSSFPVAKVSRKRHSNAGALFFSQYCLLSAKKSGEREETFPGEIPRVVIRFARTGRGKPEPAQWGYCRIKTGCRFKGMLGMEIQQHEHEL